MGDTMTDDRVNPLYDPRAVADRYRSRAAARRRHATMSVGEERRNILLSVADTYEHIAENVERDVDRQRSSDLAAERGW